MSKGFLENRVKRDLARLKKKIKGYKNEATKWELEAGKRMLNESERSTWMEVRKLWVEKENEYVSMLEQKARIRWDAEGDENSKYIMDGILIANESIEYEKKSKGKGLIFKVDFEKAYDSINWRFLLDIMKRMGLRVKWCKWIESCLKSATMSVLVNGSPTEEFCLERGVRYLGLPIGENMRRVSAWIHVIEKFKKRLVEWKAKSMSFGGRLTFVKSVLGSLPLYYFLMFHVPVVKGGGVWSEIIRIGEELEELGIEFLMLFEGEVGNGGISIFDHLNSSKEGRVADKGRWVDIEWIWEWVWVRELRGRVGMEEEDED
ncbi:RNA-directed DNA polymerase, eukaryota, reverse transcriptase zinc-binding domain protein, partial [Tanacetum coccineum]